MQAHGSDLPLKHITVPSSHTTLPRLQQVKSTEANFQPSLAVD